MTVDDQCDNDGDGVDDERDDDDDDISGLTRFSLYLLKMGSIDTLYIK